MALCFRLMNLLSVLRALVLAQVSIDRCKNTRFGTHHAGLATCVIGAMSRFTTKADMALRKSMSAFGQ